MVKEKIRIELKENKEGFFFIRSKNYLQRDEYDSLMQKFKDNSFFYSPEKKQWFIKDYSDIYFISEDMEDFEIDVIFYNFDLEEIKQNIYSELLHNMGRCNKSEKIEVLKSIIDKSYDLINRFEMLGEK